MRVKRGVAHVKRRKNILEDSKGYRWGRKSQIRKAKQAITRAGRHAYRGRKLKKRDYRGLWQTRIGAATKAEGLSYSKFIHQLKLANVELDRKVMSELAANHPEVFKAIFAQTK